MLPSFLLVGAQKSGTTTLIHSLAGHPDVVARTDELHFFDRHFDRGVDWYESCFHTDGAPAAVGESTPEYMFDPLAPARIAATLPDVRLLAILRDPVERAYSHYWHNRSRDHEPLPFGEAIHAEESRRDERFAYVARGRYREQLVRLCEHVDRERVHVVVAERLWNEPQRELDRVHAFLGLAEFASPSGLGRVRNPHVEFRSSRLRGPIRRLPMPLRRVAARLNAKRSEYPDMLPEVRARLIDTFATPNAELREWLGDDVPEWT